MARLHELTRNEPAVYYVLENGWTAVAFPSTLIDTELKALADGKAKILRRRLRRAAFRRARKPWPVGGYVLPRADYASA